MQLACQVTEAGRGKPLLRRGDSESADRVAAAVVLHNRNSSHADLTLPPVGGIAVDTNLFKLAKQGFHRDDGPVGAPVETAAGEPPTPRILPHAVQPPLPPRC